MNDGRILDDEAAESLRLYALLVRDARATERRHCIDLLIQARADYGCECEEGYDAGVTDGINAAISCLSDDAAEASTPVPVASSPVGGEQ